MNSFQYQEARDELEKNLWNLIENSELSTETVLEVLDVLCRRIERIKEQSEKCLSFHAVCNALQQRRKDVR